MEFPESQQKQVSAGDERLARLEAWVRQQPGMADAVLEPASGDASFRRYFRVRTDNRTWIVMDAPPPMEDCRPFVAIAGYLRAMSLNSPEIIAGDVGQGFLLMTDFGNDTYLDVLGREPAREASLYLDAIDALLRMQQGGARYRSKLPPYDEALLRREMALFSDWLCKEHLGIELGESDRRNWQQVCDRLVENALSQPRVFVHRDYHSRNLMVTRNDNPGIIDFQDAMDGPLTYDLASLLKDCYVRLDEARVDDLLTRYFRGLEGAFRASLAEPDFRRCFHLMGVQRHLKAAGIFARLLHRDGKDGYMRDVPRTLGYIVSVAPSFPELEWLAGFIGQRVLPALGQQP